MSQEHWEWEQRHQEEQALGERIQRELPGEILIRIRIPDEESAAAGWHSPAALAQLSSDTPVPAAILSAGKGGSAPRNSTWIAPGISSGSVLS